MLFMESVTDILQSAKNNQGAILGSLVASIAGGVTVRWYIYRANVVSQDIVSLSIFKLLQTSDPKRRPAANFNPHSRTGFLNLDQPPTATAPLPLIRRPHTSQPPPMGKGQAQSRLRHRGPLFRSEDWKAWQILRLGRVPQTFRAMWRGFELRTRKQMRREDWWGQVEMRLPRVDRPSK
jgi:hypothetical protein